MGFKGPGIGAAGHALQHRRFDLEEVPFIQPAAHGAHHAGAAAEGFAGLGRHDQVEVALAVARLHIGQTMPLIRQGLEALGQHRPGRHLHRQLTPVGAAQGAAHADQVAGIHQGGDLGEVAWFSRSFRASHSIRGSPLPRDPIQGGLLQVELDRTGLIGQGEEGQLAHHPPRHHPAGDGHLQVPLFPVGQVGMVLLQGRGAMAGVKTQGIGPLA